MLILMCVLLPFLPPLNFSTHFDSLSALFKLEELPATLGNDVLASRSLFFSNVCLISELRLELPKTKFLSLDLSF